MGLNLNFDFNKNISLDKLADDSTKIKEFELRQAKRELNLNTEIATANVHAGNQMVRTEIMNFNKSVTDSQKKIMQINNNSILASLSENYSLLLDTVKEFFELTKIKIKEELIYPLNLDEVAKNISQATQDFNKDATELIKELKLKEKTEKFSHDTYKFITEFDIKKVTEDLLNATDKFMTDTKEFIMDKLLILQEYIQKTENILPDEYVKSINNIKDKYINSTKNYTTELYEIAAKSIPEKTKMDFNKITTSELNVQANTNTSIKEKNETTILLKDVTDSFNITTNKYIKDVNTFINQDSALLTKSVPTNQVVSIEEYNSGIKIANKQFLKDISQFTNNTINTTSNYIKNGIKEYIE